MNLTKTLWFIRSKIAGFQYGKIGAHSYIGKPLFIQRPGNIYIGNNVRIYPGLRAEITKASATVVIDDNVSIGQGCHLVSYDDCLRIRKNTTISGNVFISDVDHDYKEIDLHILQQQMKKKYTEIGENCFIGYGAVILPGTVLGRQCIVGANSVVRGNYEDYCVLSGSPAKVIKKFSKETKQWEKQ